MLQVTICKTEIYELMTIRLRLVYKSSAGKTDSTKENLWLKRFVVKCLYTS